MRESDAHEMNASLLKIAQQLTRIADMLESQTPKQPPLYATTYAEVPPGWPHR